MTANANHKHQAGLFTRRYRSALHQHIKDSSRAKPAAARKLGLLAVRAGLDVLELAAIHERALTDPSPTQEPAGTQRRIARRAATFFAETTLPVEATHQTAIENNACLLSLNRDLKQRTREVATARRKLDAEIAKRQSFEQNLRKSESETRQLLLQSRELQEDLRCLSRRILITQEEERKRISRELHDIVAQTLTAINLHLATLKAEAVKHASGMKRDITRTQKLVERSVDKVYRFARELRPAVLDDLGLIPALRSLVVHFTKESSMRINFTACAQVESLNNGRRTVLYRVAQEALANAARHAQATSVTVQITEVRNAVCMQIQDDGRSFDVEQVLRTGRCKRMGLLGMRERVELVGGRFSIESVPGQGTTITAQIPFRSHYRETNRK